MSAGIRSRAGDWTLVFASEVRAILASGLIEKARLSLSAAASVVWNGFVMGPETIVAGIESLWPGEYRIYGRAGQTAGDFFWTMPRRSDPIVVKPSNRFTTRSRKA